VTVSVQSDELLISCSNDKPMDVNLTSASNFAPVIHLRRRVRQQLYCIHFIVLHCICILVREKCFEEMRKQTGDVKMKNRSGPRTEPCGTPVVQ